MSKYLPATLGNRSDVDWPQLDWNAAEVYQP
jgi:hypothetical protein